MSASSLSQSYGTWTATFLGEEFKSRREQECLDWLTMKRDALVIDTTPRMGVFDGFRHKGANLMRRTLDVWDKLDAAQLHPYDCSNGMITMQPHQFKKAFGGRPCSKLSSRGAIIFSVWVGHVEITCISDEKPVAVEELCPAI